MYVVPAAFVSAGRAVQGPGLQGARSVTVARVAAVIVSRLRLLAGVSVAVLAAGCAGSGGVSQRDAGKVKQTVRTALADLAKGNGTAFCSLTTRTGQAKLAGTLHGYSCAALVNLVGGHLSPDTRTGLLHAEVMRVTITGSTASVRASDITAPDGALKGFLNDGGRPTTLVRQPDGSWKIND